MDSFELNKIIGALLGVIFVIFSVSLISGAIFHSEPPEQPGYAIEVTEGPAAGAAEEKPAESEDIAPLLASADPQKGENIFKRCHACHTIEKGGPNKVGPNLWGVVGRPVAGHEGFSYSAGMKEFAQTTPNWDYEHLNHFLADPRGYVAGTAMTFAGLSNIQDRADVIAYLREQADSPVPLPEPKAEPEEQGQAANENGASESGEDGGKAAAEQGGSEAAPAEEGQQAAPAEGGQQAAPAEEGQQETAPAEEDQQAAPDQSDEQRQEGGDAPASSE